jgi:hypothetical protein
MRTTLRLDDQLLADIKKLAIDSGRTFTQVVEDALRMVLAQRRHQRSRQLTKLHTCGGKGLQPGVDLESNSATADLMDEFDGITRR